MYTKLDHRLNQLHTCGDTSLFLENRIGLEKESLRVTPNGTIAQTPHPHALGSALTHPYITTDYSEALTEIITPPFSGIQDTLDFLRDLHTFVYRHIDNELLWATSMPCVLAGDQSVPIAQYGKSNAGMMKTVYRRGLGHRYSRTMQVISGVHFNFSLSPAFWQAYADNEAGANDLQFTSESYMGMIRNLQRYGWLIPYLFGASPAVCKSFLNGRPTAMQDFDEFTYYYPYATSLRMGDIGYQNNKEFETGFKASYDSLDAYIRSLGWAITTPCPQYEQLGVIVNGQYEQLNANILQIENEYYSTIRPKQVLQSGERPTLALRRRGIRYVELRSLDVNAYEPLGINWQQMLFLEAFLIFCQLQDSPRLSALEQNEIDANEIAAAHKGRDPKLLLQRQGSEVALSEWAREIVTQMAGVAELLDVPYGDGRYRQALALQLELVDDPDQTPSARMLAEMRDRQEPFAALAMRLSHQHASHFRQQTLSPTQNTLLEQIAGDSLLRQREIEEHDSRSFEDYLAAYYAPA